MLSITSYTKVGIRLATILGACSSCLSILVAIIYFVMKLLHWYDYPAGMAPLIIGVFLMLSVQTFFIGMIGEYVLSINQRVMNRPLVIEEERLNFEKSEEQE